MEDRTRRSIEHAIKFFREMATEARAQRGSFRKAEYDATARMIGYDNGRADALELVANHIESIVRDEDELNGLVPPRDLCQVCNGLGYEAGRNCSACNGRGFFSPSWETTDDEKAPL